MNTYAFVVVGPCSSPYDLGGGPEEIEKKNLLGPSPGKNQNLSNDSKDTAILNPDSFNLKFNGFVGTLTPFISIFIAQSPVDARIDTMQQNPVPLYVRV